MANKPNPNGANQYHLDPRQKLCWDLYIDPRSETFGNATQSAIRAGYEPDYADQMSTVYWFKGKVRRLNMLSKAEEVLGEMIEMDDTQPILSDDGKIIDRKRDSSLTRIKQDTAKFVAERVGKENWSSRQELTGADGTRLIPVSDEEQERINQALNAYLNPKSGDDTDADHTEPTADDSGHSTDGNDSAAESDVPVPSDGDGGTVETEVQSVG